MALFVTKIICSNRNVYFREVSSGLNVNAIFIGINFTSTFETLLQMVPASGLVFVVRNSVTSYGVYLCNFILLAWVASGWSYFLCPMVRSENASTVVMFIVIPISLIFSGAVPPYEYEQIYSSKFNQLLTGFISPTRFFQESLIVSEFKWYVFIHLLCCLRYTVELID